MYVMFFTTRAGTAASTVHYFFFCGAGSVITPRPREMSVVAPQKMK